MVAWSRDWISAVHRALRPDGTFWLAIGDEYAADLAVIARREIGFNLRNWIIWHYTFGQQTKFMFAKSHTHIFYFTKSVSGPGVFTEPRTSNRPSTPLPSSIAGAAGAQRWLDGARYADASQFGPTSGRCTSVIGLSPCGGRGSR